MQENNLPGLSNRTTRSFLGIAHGKITYRPGRDEAPMQYDQFEGVLDSITLRETTINGNPLAFYDLLMHNNGHEYILSVPVSGGASMSIILSIASVEDIAGKTVRIVPYSKNVNGKEFTNAIVYVNGQKTNWVIEKLPPTVEKQFGSHLVKDNSDRIALVNSYVAIINGRLKNNINPETQNPEPPFVDMETGEIPEDIGS